MTVLGSLQARLALSIGLGVTLIWIVAAVLTGKNLHHEIDEVFDSALQETAQRILPLAVMDILGREEEGTTLSVTALREHAELFTYVVRDGKGRVLLTSHAADLADFPAYDGIGFRQTSTHRLYYESTLQGSINIGIAEPFSHRESVIHEMQLGLGSPLLLVIPLSLLAIFFTVRLSFRSLRVFRNDLATRNAQDLTPVDGRDLPNEIAPVSVALNQLLGRLDAAVEAERSFAANAAHELRTPVAGAIAHAQRIQAETTDAKAAGHAAQIETALKRLTQMSEKLRQLARAEGGRMRTGRSIDLRPILETVLTDFEKTAQIDRFDFSLPESPVFYDIDPDAFGILCRNLIENALNHGCPNETVSIRLTAGGRLSVVNSAEPIPLDKLAVLTSRFERGATAAQGSGLGLAIVRAITEGANGTLTLNSRPDAQGSRFEAVVDLPTNVESNRRLSN